MMNPRCLFTRSCLGSCGFSSRPGRHLHTADAGGLPHFPRRAIFSAFRRPPGQVPTRICAFLGTGTHARHTGQHPSSHLQDCMNNTNTIQHGRKWCQTSSLTSCVPPVGLFPVAFDKEICDVLLSGVFRSGQIRGGNTQAATNRCFMMSYLAMKCCQKGQFDAQIMLIIGSVG